MSSALIDNSTVVKCMSGHCGVLSSTSSAVVVVPVCYGCVLLYE